MYVFFTQEVSKTIILSSNFYVVCVWHAVMFCLIWVIFIIVVDISHVLLHVYFCMEFLPACLSLHDFNKLLWASITMTIMYPHFRNFKSQLKCKDGVNHHISVQLVLLLYNFI